MSDNQQEKSQNPSQEQPPKEIDFSTFIFSLGSAALIQLGITPNPITNKTEKDVAHAKQNIDLLSLLKDKTRGNLTKEETQLLDNLLHTLRLKYIEVTG